MGRKKREKLSGGSLRHDRGSVTARGALDAEREKEKCIDFTALPVLHQCLLLAKLC